MADDKIKKQIKYISRFALELTTQKFSEVSILIYAEPISSSPFGWGVGFTSRKSVLGDTPEQFADTLESKMKNAFMIPTFFKPSCYVKEILVYYKEVSGAEGVFSGNGGHVVESEELHRITHSFVNYKWFDIEVLTDSLYKTLAEYLLKSVLLSRKNWAKKVKEMKKFGISRTYFENFLLFPTTSDRDYPMNGTRLMFPFTSEKRKREVDETLYQLESTMTTLSASPVVLPPSPVVLPPSPVIHPPTPRSEFNCLEDLEMIDFFPDITTPEHIPCAPPTVDTLDEALLMVDSFLL